jgi:antitoxin YqcF
MSPVPETARVVARAAAAAFGGKPEVHAHRDGDGANSVDIVAGADRPSPGLVSYSTLTLHMLPNKIEDDDIRVELAGVAEDSVKDFPNRSRPLLSTSSKTAGKPVRGSCFRPC